MTRVDLDGNRYRRAVWLAPTDRSAPPYPSTSGDSDVTPVWSPDGRRLAFTGKADGEGGALLRGRAARRAGALTVLSPAGDVALDAWIIRPLDAGGRVRVLLSIHGGPMTQYLNAWFDEFQLLAGAGYAVVYTNPHGSSGGPSRSCARSAGRRRRWCRAPDGAGVDADDILAVLDAALERDPSLDPDRVVVLGGCYLGYLSSRLVGHTPTVSRRRAASPPSTTSSPRS